MIRLETLVESTMKLKISIKKPVCLPRLIQVTLIFSIMNQPLLLYIAASRKAIIVFLNSEARGVCAKEIYCSNVMILQDLLKNYRRKNSSPKCALKIDISKAYDMVYWDFLEDLLNAFKLPRKFVDRVMICVRNTSYTLLMNGRMQGMFNGAKGL
uniref:Reverse transcriptase domain-containing protein n=1 Tax=Cannabis sativa TaxID=3483 RepID=A0A803QLN3_CANSA